MANEEILPNCLTKTRKVDTSMTAGTWYYLFCASCGADGGRVLDTFLPEQYAFYLCNYCAEHYGEIAGTSMTPDDVFRRKVEIAMVEKYGHGLNEFEVLRELDDKYSVISKLEKEGQRRR